MRQNNEHNILKVFHICTRSLHLCASPYVLRRNQAGFILLLFWGGKIVIMFWDNVRLVGSRTRVLKLKPFGHCPLYTIFVLLSKDKIHLW